MDTAAHGRRLPSRLLSAVLDQWSGNLSRAHYQGKRCVVAARYITRLAAVPKLPLGKADFEFEVRKDGRAYGMLAISRGALVWRSASDKSEYKIDWQRFNSLALDEGVRLSRARHGNRKTKPTTTALR